MDYSKTVNLPVTAFPMKANLPVREPDYQKLWEEKDIYNKALNEAKNGTFILHDGPPYSNGEIHIGHALNKILKDIIVRYYLMNGKRSDYYPGWDNHGLPIENKVSEQFAKKKITPEKTEMRKACREYASKWIDIQREGFKRLGIFAHWDNPYLTMTNIYEATIIKVFGELVQQGYIYRGLRPIHWCVNCETALADAEIEYADHSSTSIYVRFPLLSDPDKKIISDKPVYIIIWTTTPWTIPSNLAVAVHSDYEYAVCETGDSCYILAAELAEKAFGEIGITDYQVKGAIKGSDLYGIDFKHPIYDRKSPVLLADYVTLEDGTGVVHTAPGHGKEDFETGKRYGLEVLNPVNGKGCYTDEAPGFEGLHVFRQGNQAVLDKLAELGALLASSTITHSYPHCWRCHKPVIFRATPQWFMSLDHNGLRDKILEEIKNVEFFPKEAENRLTAMMANAPDWCLSRQRSWGVGIPVMYCSECNEPILDKAIIDKVYEDALINSSDSWYANDASYFMPEGYKCPKCGNTHFIKESDVLDVWFDSGSSCRAVLDNFEHVSFPSDMYLEGSDQHRGWFNKSIVVGVATRGRSPFRQLVSHGFVLDKDGKAMSKSLGNTIPPKDIIKNMGADVLRLYIATCDYADDIRVGQEMLKNASDVYRRIRNTFRFMLGNLNDFDYSANKVSYDRLADIDKYALCKLQELIEEVGKAYESYEFHKAVKAISNFCSTEMSSLYLDILKDRLYTSGSDWQIRRSAQTGLFIILRNLVRLTAPIIPHTSEEVWQFMPDKDKEESVFLAGFPVADEQYKSEEVLSRWNEILKIRELVLLKLEEAKTNGVISKPIEAKVTIHLPAELIGLFPTEETELASYFIVSQVELVEGATDCLVEKAEGEKCERCWLIMKSTGSDTSHPTLCSRCAKAIQ